MLLIIQHNRLIIKGPCKNNSVFWVMAPFILVGCILLRYLHMLYKHTTQTIHVIRKRNLTAYLLFQKNFTTCFGPYWPSSSDIFEDFLLYCDTSTIFTNVRLSIVYNAKGVFKMHNFLYWDYTKCI
jgi:hypothetical protein